MLLKANAKSVFLFAIFFAVVLRSSAQAIVAINDTESIRESNSKLFGLYALASPIDQLIKLPPYKGVKDIEISREAKTHNMDVTPHANTRDSYIAKTVASADLIVVGEPTARNSAFTEGRRFIFSDYTIAVNSVTWSQGVTVLPGQNIIVSRAGGILAVDGRTVRATVSNFPPFEIKDTYLMFLRILPNGSFLVFAEGAFDISGNEIPAETVGRVKHPISTKEFLEDTAQAISRIYKEGK